MATDILSSLNKNGSGLNIRELTTSLVAAEIQPRQNAIEKKVAATQTSISALGKLRAGMDKLDSALGTIAATPILAASVIGSSTTLVPTDKSQLTEGSTSFDVQSLATRQVLEFTGFTSESAPIGSGTLTVETGTWTDAATNQFTADPTKPVPSPDRRRRRPAPCGTAQPGRGRNRHDGHFGWPSRRLAANEPRQSAD